MDKSSENKRNLASLAAWTRGVHGARQELTALRGDLVPLLWLGERLGGSSTCSHCKTTGDGRTTSQGGVDFRPARACSLNESTHSPRDWLARHSSLIWR
jgi:hypothetical protein